MSDDPKVGALTLDQLRLFVCAAEEDSFSAVGRRLHRAQSAVSYGISNLEQQLGVQLFDRTGRRNPRLTDIGRSLLVDARDVLTQTGRLQARAASVAQGLEADVGIAVEGIFPFEILIELCRAFQALFPTVNLHVRIELLTAVTTLVNDGTCNVGVSVCLAEDIARLHRHFLASIGMVTVAAPGHPLTLIEPPIATSLVHDKVQIVISERIPDQKDHGVFSGVTWRVSGAATKRALLRAGLGWGHMPEHMVRKDIAGGRLVKLELEEMGPSPLLAPVYSIYHVDTPPGPAGRWLLQQLEVLCRESALLLQAQP